MISSSNNLTRLVNSSYSNDTIWYKRCFFLNYQTLPPRLITPLLLILFIAINQLTYASQNENTSQPSIEKNLIVVGGFPDAANPPYTWVNHCNGKIEGILPHVVTRALNEAGYQVEFAEPIPMNANAWTKTFEQLERGDIDMLAGMYSPAPPNMVITNHPLMKQKDTLIKRKSDQLFVTPEIFKSKNGLVSDAGPNGSKVTLLKQLRAQGYNVDNTPSVEAAVEAVLSAKADYLITDYYYALSLLTEKGLINSIEMVEWSDQARTIHAAVKKGSSWEKLIPLMDNRFAMYQQSGLTEHLSKNYLLSWLKSKKCSSLLPQGNGKLSNIN